MIEMSFVPAIPPRTVCINGLNSKDDFNLILTSVEIGGAEPKTEIITIPYSDNYIDLTEQDGEIRFKQREIEMDFMIPFMEDHFKLYSNFASSVSGEEAAIVFSADVDHYWVGRIYVKGMENSNGRWVFSATATVFPYKFRVQKNIYEGTVTTSYKRITLVNDGRKTVKPIIRCNAPVIVKTDDETVTIEPEYNTDFEMGDLAIKGGLNTIIKIKAKSGTAAYKISLREAYL